MLLNAVCSWMYTVYEHDASLKALLSSVFQDVWVMSFLIKGIKLKHINVFV